MVSMLSALVLSPSWPFAEEVSVAAAFDRVYGTHYETGGPAALARLVDERGIRVRRDYDVRTAAFVEVLVYDTSGTAPLGILVDGELLPFFRADEWTPPTRGFRPGDAARVDIAELLMSNGYDPQTHFVFAVGDTPLDSTNTLALLGWGAEALLGFNDAGIRQGDADYNEPLLRVLPTDRVASNK